MRALCLLLLLLSLGCEDDSDPTPDIGVRVDDAEPSDADPTDFGPRDAQVGVARDADSDEDGGFPADPLMGVAAVTEIVFGPSVHRRTGVAPGDR